MQVKTNEALVRRNKQMAQYLFFISFGVLLVGLFVTNLPLLNDQALPPGLVTAFIPAVVLPVGLILMLSSVRMTNLWLRLPRPENVIREGLKGMSNKSVLYNYYHFPARHVLMCPQGVFVIVTRYQDGQHSVTGGKWSTKRSPMGMLLGALWLEGIGNPTQEAQDAAAHVQKLLQPINPNLTVGALVVFTHPNVKLEVQEPAVPVLIPQEREGINLPNLKDYLRDTRAEKGAALTNAQLPTLTAAFEEATFPKPKRKR